MNNLSSFRIFFAVLCSLILSTQITQAAPAFTLPTSNNLPGHSQWFTWVNNGTPVAEYWLFAGRTVKGNQYFDSGNIGTERGKTITGLPTDGSTVYVTLWYRVSGGTWLTLNRTMTAKDNSGGSKPLFTNPRSGGALSGPSHRAQWSNNGSTVAEYWVYAGSSVGGSQYANSGSLGRSTSWTMDGLPTNGSTVYLTLWYRTSAGGAWLKVNSTATASNRSPSFTSPASGSTLSGASHSARWTGNGISVNEWWVYAGSSVGGNNYYNSGSLGGQTSSRITNLPRNGSTVHLTLWYRLTSGGSWNKVQSTVRAAGGGGSFGDPDIDAGEYGSGFTYTPGFHDEFDDSLYRQWNIVDMSDGLHRAGNTTLDRRDCRTFVSSVNGKRWSAWYNGEPSDTITVNDEEDGFLRLGGLYTDIDDPTRQPRGSIRFDEHKFYTSFLSTWDGVSVDGTYQSTGRDDNTFGPRTFIETRVSFARMNTPGFRLSAWLVPANENASNTYDASGRNGVEIDIFELDPSLQNGATGQSRSETLLMKIIGGAAGSTGETKTPGNEGVANPNGGRDTTVGDQVHVSGIRSGFHTIGLLWMPDRLVWYVNGERVQEDRTAARIPQVPHYLVLSREMNAGVVRTRQQECDNPKFPNDTGIWVGENVWDYRSRVDNDEGIFDYVRTWTVSN